MLRDFVFNYCNLSLQIKMPQSLQLTAIKFTDIVGYAARIGG